MRVRVSTAVPGEWLIDVVHSGVGERSLSVWDVSVFVSLTLSMQVASLSPTADAGGARSWSQLVRWGELRSLQV